MYAQTFQPMRLGLSQAVNISKSIKLGEEETREQKKFYSLFEVLHLFRQLLSKLLKKSVDH